MKYLDSLINVCLIAACCILIAVSLMIPPVVVWTLSGLPIWIPMTVETIILVLAAGLAKNSVEN